MIILTKTPGLMKIINPRMRKNSLKMKQNKKSKHKTKQNDKPNNNVKCDKVL